MFTKKLKRILCVCLIALAAIGWTGGFVLNVVEEDTPMIKVMLKD
ncbi:hypothetical protein [Clostridium thermarum]|nr:hypothetical protein [Clostridium thermarum]